GHATYAQLVVTGPYTKGQVGANRMPARLGRTGHASCRTRPGRLQEMPGATQRTTAEPRPAGLAILGGLEPAQESKCAHALGRARHRAPGDVLRRPARGASATTAINGRGQSEGGRGEMTLSMMPDAMPAGLAPAQLQQRLRGPAPDMAGPTMPETSQKTAGRNLLWAR